MSAPKPTTVTVEIGGRPLSIETGKLAKQSSGAVVVRQGDSSVLVTCVGEDRLAPGDFLPLQVEYGDRNGAYGTIPGNYFKREGRANERETLVSRLIDRPIRPQFPKHWRRETQIIATVLSFDQANDTDVLAMCGASAAAFISEIPMQQAIAGVRIAKIDGKLVINPGRKELVDAELSLVVAGTREAICMVEGGAKEVDETTMIDAMDLAHAEIKKIIGAIEELREKVGVPRLEVPPKPSAGAEVYDRVVELGKAALVEAMNVPGKFERKAAMKDARNAVIAQIVAGLDDAEAARLTEAAKMAWESLTTKVMRGKVIEQGVRIDGRATDEIRDIWCEVGIAPRAHGSALFTRGETQAFVTAALGVESDAQRIDYAGTQDEFRRWMLTYNFPPFSTGEARPMRGPKRREVGHGALAHRALKAVLPNHKDCAAARTCWRATAAPRWRPSAAPPWR
jgi:polyribonucleotide nucleotidyltransferase